MPTQENITMKRVFVSGCFDNLHPGHLDFLEYAKSRGDFLIVSIASDETIRKLKKREPIIPEYDRWRMIKALKCVNQCFISRGENSNFDFLEYLYNFRPNIWVINSEDKEMFEKKQIAQNLGIKIIEHHRPKNGYSTTDIIEKIKKIK